MEKKYIKDLLGNQIKSTLSFHCNQLQSLSSFAVYYSLVYQNKNNVRYSIISSQSVSVSASHNTKFFYSTDRCSTITLCLLCLLLYLLSVLVSSILRFFFTGNTALRSGKFFLFRNIQGQNSFLLVMVLQGVHRCKQYRHAAFLSYAYLICAVFSFIIDH